MIAIGSMGGTIAMAPQSAGEGLSPALGAAELIAAVPQLEELGEISTGAICNVGSPSVGFDDALAAHAWATGQVAGGADGVVITHGTDTLEETAYLLDLLWEHEAPLVLTGAMRAPDDPGADGPANLLAAALVATSRAARGLGALLVMNDEVFLAGRVRKTHSFAVDAFVAPWGTAVGRVIEGALEIDWLPAADRAGALARPECPARVAILEAGIGDDGVAFGAVAGAVDGLVIAGVGAGHVSATAADVLDEVLTRIPVVMTTRTGGGRTGRITYGYPGAEIDLIRRGVVMAGHLTAAQARLLLWVLLGQGADRERIRAEFEKRRARTRS